MKKITHGHGMGGTPACKPISGPSASTPAGNGNAGAKSGKQ